MNVISLLTPKAQVAYLYDDFTVRQGLEKLRAHGYTAIPVLARDGSYVGTVSEGDFLWNLVDRQDNSLRSKEKQPLKSVMRKSFNPPVSVGVSMEELLERSMRQSFIPVVDDRGGLCGHRHPAEHHPPADHAQGGANPGQPGAVGQRAGRRQRVTAKSPGTGLCRSQGLFLLFRVFEHQLPLFPMAEEVVPQAHKHGDESCQGVAPPEALHPPVQR